MSFAARGPTHADDALLMARKLVCGHGGRVVVPAFELTLHRGQLWALVGDNGSGKSTLMATLLGLQAPLGGTRLVRSRTRVGYVGPLQSLPPEAPMRVADLVRGGALRGAQAWFGWRQLLSKAALQGLLDDFALINLAHRPYASLSEGQKQRVALARAWASAPELLFLDEPTSAMDARQAERALSLLRKAAQRQGTCVVVVGHQLGPLFAAADQILWLRGHATAPTQGPAAALRDEVLAASLGLPPPAPHAGSPRHGVFPPRGAGVAASAPTGAAATSFAPPGAASHVRPLD